MSAFTLLKKDEIQGKARAGVLKTAHGEIETPIFMPVGTVGSVKAIAPDDLENIKAQIILGNTYHLYLRPGDELIKRRGGLHKFINWDKPILTDSGGFQVFSLNSLRKMKEEGVEFRSHIDGSKHLFTPESVIKIQNNLGSDIMMCFDECLAAPASYDDALKAVERTTRWAKRCRQAYSADMVEEKKQLLFGIVQGVTYSDLRKLSAEQLMDIGFEGYAIGGLSVGESKEDMQRCIEVLDPILPENKARYLMGVGTPLDLIEGIARGVDMFDCVLPTRNARNGTLYTSQGKLNIKRAEYAEDDSSLDSECDCYTCRNFSKAYLRHLYVSKELLSFRLNSLHNLTYFLKTVKIARQAIFDNTFTDVYNHYKSLYTT